MSTENGPETAPQDQTAAKTWSVSGRSLIQSTSVVSGMTLLSRILGLVRDMVLARFFAVFDGHGRIPGREPHTEYVAGAFSQKAPFRRVLYR